jgi:hypothetical protein
MCLLRLSTLFRLCLLAVATWLVLGARTGAMADTFADVIGVPGCLPDISTSTPAVVSCGTVGAGSRGGFASANLNLLGASASSGSNIAEVTSLAQFTDTVTFTPTITGIGFLGFRENLSGTIAGTGGGATAFGQFTASYNDTTICNLQTNQTVSIASCFAFTPALAFTAGVSQQGTLMGTLQANAKFGAFTVADFSHTADISAVDLFDANKNLIGPVELIGASGTTYGSAPPVPEPSSLLLFATGLLGLAGAAIAKWHR